MHNVSNNDKIPIIYIINSIYQIIIIFNNRDDKKIKSKTTFWSLKDLWFNTLAFERSIITLESSKDLVL